MRAKDGVGAYGEWVAATHLTSAGLTIIDQNWRCDAGEIDIVAMEGETIVICEVKTRSGLGYGSGLEAVTADKSARLRRLGGRWLAEHRQPGTDVRFDVVAVHRPHRGAATVEHLKGAF